VATDNDNVPKPAKTQSDRKTVNDDGTNRYKGDEVKASVRIVPTLDEDPKISRYKFMSEATPELKAIISPYEHRLKDVDFADGEKSVMAKIDLLKSEDKFWLKLKQIEAEKVQAAQKDDEREALFVKSRLSKAEIFHVASQGYMLARDNGRVFIRRDGDSEGFRALVLPPTAGAKGFGAKHNLTGSPHVTVKISGDMKFTGTYKGNVNDISAKEYADILTNKPTYDALTKAYCMLANEAVIFHTNKTTKIW
jgi:hypothetical protein